MSRTIFIDSGGTAVDTETLVGATVVSSRVSETLNAVAVRLSQAGFAAQLEGVVGPVAGFGTGGFGTFGAAGGPGAGGLPSVQYVQALNRVVEAGQVLHGLSGQLAELGESLTLAADVYERAERTAMGVFSDATGSHAWIAEAGVDWAGKHVSPVISRLDWSFRVGKAYLWSAPFRLAGDQSVFERALSALVIDRLTLTRTADHPVEHSAALLSQLYPSMEVALGEYRADLVMQPSLGTVGTQGTSALQWSRSDYRYGLKGFDVYNQVQSLDLNGLDSAAPKNRSPAEPISLGVAAGGLLSRSLRNRLSHPETVAVLNAIAGTKRISRPVAVPTVRGTNLTARSGTTGVRTSNGSDGLRAVSGTMGDSRISAASSFSKYTPSVPTETPQTASDLVARVKELRDNPTGAGVAGEGSTHGEFEIQRHETPGEERPSWSVVLRGTQQWHPTTPNPKDMQSNLALVGGVPSDEQAAILAALDLSGAETGDTIELVGHSQGGLVAGALASNTAFTSRYHVAGVVTAGSPIQGMDIANTTPVLSFEHTDDFVAALDGQPATPSRNHITVYSRGGDGFAHDLGGYVIDAQTADQAGNADLDRWNANRIKAMGITEDTKTTQQRYTITRVKR